MRQKDAPIRQADQHIGAGLHRQLFLQHLLMPQHSHDEGYERQGNDAGRNEIGHDRFLERMIGVL